MGLKYGEVSLIQWIEWPQKKVIISIVMFTPDIGWIPAHISLIMTV